MSTQAADHVEVRRTGGFIGRAVSGQVTLDPEAAAEDAVVAEVQALVERISFEPPGPFRGYPDMFTFAFQVGERSMVCAEPQLTDDLRRLATLVLAHADPSPTR